jgi:hypothetical protein
MRLTPTYRLIDRYNRARAESIRGHFSPVRDPCAPAALRLEMRIIVLGTNLSERGIVFDMGFTPVPRVHAA